jgi:hypothetical protein
MDQQDTPASRDLSADIARVLHGRATLRLRGVLMSDDVQQWTALRDF